MLVAASLTGCQGKDDGAASLQPVRVKTVTVGTESVMPADCYSGTVEEENGTVLSFSTAGIVQNLYVRLGQRVAAGQLLATLDSTSSRSSHQAALAALSQAEDAYGRMKELHDRGSLPDIKWVEVQSQVEQARSVEQIARKALQDCRLYAPFAGVIAEKNVETGQNVAPGIPVLRLVSTSNLKVKIAVPEAEISMMSMGQTATMTVPALGGRTFACSIMEKGIVANPLSRSYDVNLRVDGATDGLLPGMVAEVAIAMPYSEDVCVVPERIVQLDEHNSEFVWVADGGKAVKRNVVCGSFTGDGVAVTHGLEAGEQVIVEGQQKVCNGTPVSVVVGD